MQKIFVMTDSAGDIPEADAVELGIKVMPMPITHQGKSYHERVEMTNEEFYDLILSSSEIPSTSHITADTYLEEYKKIYEAGYTHVINVTINSLGSSMFDAASLAARMFYEDSGVDAAKFRIAVVDSKAYAMAYGIAVIKAARMARDSVDFDEILDYLDDWFDRLEIICSVYSLDFARKSGRINCAAAFVGELLGMRPMIAFIDGVATIIDKARGDKNVLTKLVEIVKQRSIDIEKYSVLIIRGTTAAEADNFKASLLSALPKIHIEGIYSVGASVSINCGPKVVAVVYAGKKRVK